MAALQLVLWLVGSATALAQAEVADDEELTRDDAASDEALDGGPGEAVAGDPAEATGWRAPRVLVLPENRTPDRLVNEVRDLLSGVGELVGEDDYVRSARSAGFPPTSLEAFEQLLPDQEVTLVVVIGVDREGGSRTLSIDYREGRFGGVLLSESHGLAGDRLREEGAQRIVAEARLALAALTRPQVGPDEPGASEPPLLGVEPDADRERTRPGASVQIDLSAGFGIGMRSFEVPTELGVIRLSTDPFPAARLRLGVAVEPIARGRWVVSGAVSYLTSVGLRSTDVRVDGTTRNTASRSQRVSVAAGLAHRLGDDESAVALGAELGFGYRLFSSEAPVTLPDYGLGGPELAVVATLPLLGGRLVFELAPALSWIALVDDALTREGVSGGGIALGGEIRVRFGIAGPFHVEAYFRESHVLLSSDRGDASDGERFATLSVLYRP